MKHTAGTAARIGARLIDELFVIALLWPAVGLLFLKADGAARWHFSWSYFFYFMAAPVAYYALSNWLFGRTIGKWIFSLRLIEKGKLHQLNLPFGTSLVRAIADRLTLFLSWAIYAVGLLRKDRRHLVDWLAGTQVVFEDGRALAGKRRPFVALVFIILFAASGWERAQGIAQNIRADLAGITINF